MISSLESIKLQIKNLYKSNPKIHIDLSFRSDRRDMQNIPAEITGVYPNIFTARLNKSGSERNYTFQYVDILTHAMAVRELSE